MNNEQVTHVGALAAPVKLTEEQLAALLAAKPLDGEDTGRTYDGTFFVTDADEVDTDQPTQASPTVH